MAHRPQWFRDGKIFVSFADTVGINKDGNVLYGVDAATGTRTSRVDDKVEIDVDALLAGDDAPTGRWIPQSNFAVAVPTYYNDALLADLDNLLESPMYRGLSPRSLGELIDEHLVAAFAGHGSPAADLRDGSVPYIKVSDIRAGQININPSNLVADVIAERFWKGKSSGLRPFDLVSPMRASKNIGEFAILMPGQERIVLTKEVLILRAAARAPVDQHFLMWALSLRAVRNQWKRVVFMQTNREDVGNRFREIQIPWPDGKATALRVSKAFRTYYEGMDTLRSTFIANLQSTGDHHVFLGSADSADEKRLKST
jgi:type I restriction enzyme M protein